MKPTRAVAVFVGLLILNGVVAGNAFATPVVACQVQHNLLQADLRASQPSFRNQTDFERSQKILTDAWMDLTGGFQDPVAVQKMTNFQMSLNADPAVAQRLAARAQGVIDCVNSLPAP